MLGLLMYMLGILFMKFILEKKILMIWVQNMLFLLIFIYIFNMLNIQYYMSWFYIYMDYSVDKISVLLIMLSIWIICLMYMSILNSLQYYYKILSYELLLLLMILILFFYSMDLINFYLFFEISLIPILLMVLGWGGQSERLQAGLYMLMYTLVFSLPFFFLLMVLKYNNLTLNFMLMILMNLDVLNSSLIYLFIMMIFMVKLPIYFIHLWLPKAHVEAPIFGSMILAGVLLKLGGYGILRMIMIFYKMNLNFNLFLIIIIIWGSINISLICMRQIDLKMMIAYSSIVHMGLMVSGLLTLYMSGLYGGMLMMIGHGLCSSGLFCLLNFSYKRVNSRNLLINKGMGQYFLNMSLWWFIFCVMNISAPPSLNLVSEILLIISLLKISMIFIIMIFLLSFFSSVYSIYLFSYTQQGKNFIFLSWNNYNTIDEFLLMILHWIPLNLFILNLLFFF